MNALETTVDRLEARADRAVEACRGCGDTPAAPCSRSCLGRRNGYCERCLEEVLAFMPTLAADDAFVAVAAFAPLGSLVALDD